MTISDKTADAATDLFLYIEERSPLTSTWAEIAFDMGYSESKAERLGRLLKDPAQGLLTVTQVGTGIGSKSVFTARQSSPSTSSPRSSVQPVNPGKSEGLGAQSDDLGDQSDDLEHAQSEGLSHIETYEDVPLTLNELRENNSKNKTRLEPVTGAHPQVPTKFAGAKVTSQVVQSYVDEWIADGQGNETLVILGSNREQVLAQGYAVVNDLYDSRISTDFTFTLASDLVAWKSESRHADEKAARGAAVLVLELDLVADTPIAEDVWRRVISERVDNYKPTIVMAITSEVGLTRTGVWEDIKEDVVLANVSEVKADFTRTNVNAERQPNDDCGAKHPMNPAIICEKGLAKANPVGCYGQHISFSFTPGEMVVWPAPYPPSAASEPNWHPAHSSSWTKVERVS